MGNGMDESNIPGPVANQMQFDKVKRPVIEAKQEGRILPGGDAGEGLFFNPAIIADLTNESSLVGEEQFGPALPIIRFSNIDDAIALANDSENGLGGSVWSDDVAKAKEIVNKMECDTVWINNHGLIQPNAPFGGTKKSGIGVEFGQED